MTELPNDRERLYDTAHEFLRVMEHRNFTINDVELLGSIMCRHAYYTGAPLQTLLRNRFNFRNGAQCVHSPASLCSNPLDGEANPVQQKGSYSDQDPASVVAGFQESSLDKSIPIETECTDEIENFLGKPLVKYLQTIMRQAICAELDHSVAKGLLMGAAPPC